MRRLLLLLILLSAPAFAQNTVVTGESAGASTNPTSGTIPIKSGATFVDSWWSQSGSNENLAAGKTLCLNGSVSGFFCWLPPSTITSYTWTPPNADSLGALSSDGSGNLSLNAFSGTGNIVRSAGVASATGNYSLVAADVGRTRINTDTVPVTYTFTAAPSTSYFPQDSYVTIKNNGSAALTISITGATIDTFASINVPPADSVIVSSDGSNFFTGVQAVRGKNPLDMSTISIDEDFCGGTSSTTTVGKYGWALRNTGSASQNDGTFPDLCGIRINSSATASNHSSLELSTASHFGALGSNANWASVWRFDLVQTTNTRAYIGFRPAGTAIRSDGFWIRYDTNAGTADAAFKIEVCKASACTVHGTTYTVDTGKHNIFIRSITAGEIRFRVDSNAEICFNAGGTGGCTASANVPIVALTAITDSGNDTSATNSSIDAWHFGFRVTGLSR